MEPDFFLKLLLQSEKPDHYRLQLHQNLTTAFEFLANDLENPVPYNYELLEFISSKRYLEVLPEGHSIICAPTDFDIWRQEYLSKLVTDYRNWIQLHRQGHVFSYFVVAYKTVALIGTLQARIEEDINNIPANHITGCRHPADFITSAKNCSRLVKYYLVAALNLPKEEVEDTLRYLVIEWQNSMISKFSELSGTSFCFLLTALVFTSAIRDLVVKEVAYVIDHSTDANLTAKQIQLPIDILMSGDFDHQHVPDELRWNEPYRPIPTRQVKNCKAKIHAALGVNKVQPLFQQLLLPHDTVLRQAKDDKLVNSYDYQGCGIYEELFITLQPIKNIDELIAALFPDIVFGKAAGKKSYQSAKTKTDTKKIYTASLLLVAILCLLALFAHQQQNRQTPVSPPFSFELLQRKSLDQPWQQAQMLTSGCYYKLRLTVSAKTYLYAFQKDSSGQLQPIFPTADPRAPKSYQFSFDNPVIPGTYEIPPQQKIAFQLDNITGQEYFYFIYHNRPLTDPQKHLHRHLTGGETTARFVIKKIEHR